MHLYLHLTGLVNDHQRSNINPSILDSQCSVLLRVYRLRPPYRLDPPTTPDRQDPCGVYLCLGGGLSLDGRGQGLQGVGRAESVFGIDRGTGLWGPQGCFDDRG